MALFSQKIDFSAIFVYLYGTSLTFCMFLGQFETGRGEMNASSWWPLPMTAATITEIIFLSSVIFFAFCLIFFTICAEKVCYKLCNGRYKLSNTCYKLCNTRYKVCNKKISYKIVKTFKEKGKNSLGIIRFVFAQKVSPKAACNAIFHYGTLYM